ncbi:uncharacterized protein LOC131299078 [Rhododendron vialii]|uniref:uncharacterized protein LOC131299078 n=1 Tax=Rhododendron vialii TaxID=182163 RepID=UPI00265DAB6B|nr:uncharacterized protein LOC131299078 [Rhododendron vialii]
MFNMKLLKRKQKRGRGGRESTEIESRKKEKKQEERREYKGPERKIKDREKEEKEYWEKQEIEILWELEKKRYMKGEIEPEEKEREKKEKKKEGEIERGDMEKQLFDAAMRGDIESLRSIIDSDDYILDRVPMGDFKEKNPLHVAISTRRKECVDLLLKKQPDLAEVLDPELGVALHIASAKGHLEIVELLLKVSPAMCLARDSHGNNPLHIAAMKGKDYVLRKLVETNPFAARVRVDKGDTILHLCVNYNRATSLELLLDMIRDQEFVNSVDTDGNNILHLAVLGRQFEIVALVLYNTKIDVNARNKSGSTALDIHYIVTNREDTEQVFLESHVLQDKKAAERIEFLLHKAGAKRRGELFLPYQPSWQKNKNETLLIVSSLIATMAFQVGLNPPGSVWQDNSVYEAGKSITAYHYPFWYPILMYVNTAGFLLSLTTILLLIMALPAEGKVFGAIRSFASWLTIMATAFVYTFCITVVTPNVKQSASYAIVYLVMTWACMISLYLLKYTRQSIRSLMEERVNQKKNRERITWTRPPKQLSIKVVGREDEAGLSTNVEASASGSNEAGGSGSTSLVKREGKQKEAMEPNVEAGTSGYNEAGGSGSSSLIQPQRKQKEAMETLPGMIQPSPVSVEASGSKKIEAGGSIEVKVGESGSNEDGESIIEFSRKRQPRPFPIEVGGSKKIEAGGSESDEVGRSKEIEVGGSKSDEAGISKEIEVAVSDEIEADRSGSDEAGITKEIEGGGSKEIEAVRSRSDEADISKKIEAGRSESDEAGGSEEIEVRGSEEIEAGGSNKIEVCGSKEIEAGRSECTEV